MVSSLSEQLGKILLSYVGPETNRVRTAIARLAKDDPAKMEHYVRCAIQDYRDVLWWAEIDEREEPEERALSGMTVNERLGHLNLFTTWDQAIAAQDRETAKTVLRQCRLEDGNVDAILRRYFSEPN